MAPPPGVIEAGVLPHQEILRLCGLQGNELEESEGVGPIQPCRRKNVRSASYDLRLGSDYQFSEPLSEGGFKGSGMQIATLTPGRDEHIVLEPNQVVVVSSLEKVCMPDDMIGHLTLKQDLLLQGLIMASQSQIDAGYRGWIYPLFYNLTDRPVMLRLNQSIIRLELVRLEQPSDAPYDGDYQEKTLAESLKGPIGSSLADFRREVTQHGREVKAVRRVFDFAAALSLALAAVVFPFMTGLYGDVTRLEGKVEGSAVEVERSEKTENELRLLKKRVAELQCEVSQDNPAAARNRC